MEASNEILPVIKLKVKNMSVDKEVKKEALKSKTILSVMKKTVVALEKADTSSKELFQEALKNLKEVKELKEGVIALNTMADSLTTTKHYQNKIKAIVKYASIATNTKLFIDTDSLLWYNVEKALKLMEHLQEFYPSDVSKVKNQLNKLRPKGINIASNELKRKYNNDYGNVLTDLYKEYKLEDTDEQSMVKLEALFAKLSTEGKAKMIAKLTGLNIVSNEEKVA